LPRTILRALLLVLLPAGLSGAAAEKSRPARDDPARLPVSLDPLFRQYPAPTDKALKALKRGVQAYLDGRYAAALESLPVEPSLAHIAVGDFSLLYRGKACLALERGEEALENFRRLPGHYPASSQLTEALLGECQAHLKLRNPPAALAALQESKLPESPEVMYFRGRAQEESGNREQAVDLYLRVYADFVNADVSALARQRLIGQVRTLLLPRYFEALLQRGENLIRAGKNRDARSLLLQLAQVRAPDVVKTARRLVLLAEAELNLGRASAALALLQRTTTMDPVLHARSLYLKGLCYRKMQKESSFLAARDLALKLHPGSPFTEKLLYAAAAYFDVNGRSDLSRESYRNILTHFPSGEYAARAAWKLALLAYIEQRCDEALRGFWKYLEGGTNSHDAPAALYWMGRCYEKLGDSAHAAQLYSRARALANSSYYGQRARDAELELKKAAAVASRPFAGFDFDQVARKVDGMHLPQSSIRPPSAAAAVLIERARQLAAADLPDLALAELRWGLLNHPDEKSISYVMSRIYKSKGDSYGMITTLRRAFPDYGDRALVSLPEEVWGLLFPVLHWGAISKHAAKNNLDANLVLGLIRQESAFTEDARSPANARGLMQVLPATGRKLARQAGLSRYSTSALYRAETNIALGTRHLAQLLQHFDGRVELALAAYNAGDSRVDRWMKDFETLDMAEFVERIPFSETRIYVKQVLSNKAYYRLLTASPNGASR